jgi:SSS family solute:Na+ symporter
MLNWLDVTIFLAFFGVVVGVSMYKSGGGGESSEDYFLGGRGLPWGMIGLSIVAANISTEQFVGMAGQGAGAAGLAASAWQLTGSIGIVVAAFVLLPRFLKAGIYTIPEYLEYRYNPSARAIMAFLTMLVYVGVTITAVLYSGGLMLATIFNMNLTLSVWVVGLVAALYTSWGGLGAVAWADLFLGTALILGGFLTMYLGFDAVGGVDSFLAYNDDKLHMMLPADNELLPWTGIVFGMWIPIFYYTGLNQFIVQRTLGAKSLRQGQLGAIFAGALWLVVPFAIVFPGMMADQLYGGRMETMDQAYPMLIRNLIPMGLRGFMFAAISGAVISSLASMLNSASTIFTMDFYKEHVRPEASQSNLVTVGRVMTILFVVIGCLIAPILDDPRFKGVFNYLQEFQGYISPGIVAAFLVGILVKRAPASAGVTALLANPVIYGFLQWQFSEIYFLIRMPITFVIIVGLMMGLRFTWPLDEPRSMPEREDVDMESSPFVKWCGAAVLAGVVVFFIAFW